MEKKMVIRALQNKSKGFPNSKCVHLVHQIHIKASRQLSSNRINRISMDNPIGNKQLNRRINKLLLRILLETHLHRGTKIKGNNTITTIK